MEKPTLDYFWWPKEILVEGISPIPGDGLERKKEFAPPGGIFLGGFLAPWPPLCPPPRFLKGKWLLLPEGTKREEIPPSFFSPPPIFFRFWGVLRPQAPLPGLSSPSQSQSNEKAPFQAEKKETKGAPPRRGFFLLISTFFWPPAPKKKWTKGDKTPNLEMDLGRLFP